MPDWVTSRAVPKAIAEVGDYLMNSGALINQKTPYPLLQDVLQFLAWMRQKRDKPAGSTANAVATTSKNA